MRRPSRRLRGIAPVAILRLSAAMRARRFPIVNVAPIAMNLAVWLVYEHTDGSCSDRSPPGPRATASGGEPSLPRDATR